MGSDRTNSKIAIWNRALHRVGETKALVESDVETGVRPAARACGLAYDDIVDEVLGAYPWPFATREKPLTAIDLQATTWLYAAGVDPWKTWSIPYPFLDPSQVTVTHIDAVAVETELVADTDYTYPAYGEGSDRTVLLTTALVAGESLKIEVTTAREGWDHVYPLPSDCVTPISLLNGSRHIATPVDLRSAFALALSDSGEGLLLCTDLAATEFSSLQYVARVSTVAVWPREFLDAVIWRLSCELATALVKDPKRSDYCAVRYDVALALAMDRSGSIGHELEPTTPGLLARG